MTRLVFRNVDASPDDPVVTWPSEAIRAALEQGYLTQWRRMLAEIRADPWGPFARRVEQVLTHTRPYGIGLAFERAIGRARERQLAADRQSVAEELRGLLEASGLTQAEVAARLGTSQSRLSSYVTGRVTPSAALLVRARRVLGS